MLRNSQTFLKSRLIPALLASVLALPAAAYAQTAAAPGNVSGGPGATVPTSAPPIATTRKPTTRVAARQGIDARIEELHSKLMITAAQQPQWDQFTQVMRDNAQAMSQGFQARSAQVQSMNAADNMQSYATVAEQHAQNMQKLATAFQTLYNGLSPEQKKAADKTFHDSMAERRGANQPAG